MLSKSFDRRVERSDRLEEARRQPTVQFLERSDIDQPVVAGDTTLTGRVPTTAMCVPMASAPVRLCTPPRLGKREIITVPRSAHLIRVAR